MRPGFAHRFWMRKPFFRHGNLIGRAIDDGIRRIVMRALRRDPLREVKRIAIRTRIDDLSKPPIDVADVYLRLQLLSHRLVRPRD